MSKIRTQAVIDAGYVQHITGVAEHPLGSFRYQCTQCRWWSRVAGPVCYNCGKSLRPLRYWVVEELTEGLLVGRLEEKARLRAARRRQEAF